MYIYICYIYYILYIYTIDISNWTTDHPLKSSRGDALFAQPRLLVHWMRTPGSAKHHKDWGVGENVTSPLWVAIRPIRFCSCLGSGVISELKTQISCSHSWCWIYHDIYIYMDISWYIHIPTSASEAASGWPSQEKHQQVASSTIFLTSGDGRGSRPLLEPV